MTLKTDMESILKLACQTASKEGLCRTAGDCGTIECQFITEQIDQILALPGLAELEENQELPKPDGISFYLAPSVLAVSQAGIALENNLLPTYQQAQQDMLKANFRKVKVKK